MAYVKRDIQRSKVYNWEDSLPLWAVGIDGRRSCSLRRCRELVDAATKLYGLPKIEVRVPEVDNKNSSAYYQEYFISLPKHFHRKDVALHEAAHYITGVLWPKATDHGPVFVRVYMHLLHELLGGDIKWLEDYARFHSVKFSTRKTYSPGYKTLTPWQYASLQMDINQLSFLKR